MKKTIFTIALLLFFISCGSRKAEKNKTFELISSETSTVDKTKNKAEKNVQQQVFRTTDNKDETVTETVIYTPIDHTKPATVTDEEGKTHSLNNSSYKKERTVKKNNVSVKENSNKEITEKTEILKDLKILTENYNKTDAEQINIDRQSWSLWNLLWFAIPIGLIAVFFKYKGKIWWI